MFNTFSAWLARQILSLPYQEQAFINRYPMSARNAARLSRKR